MTAGGRCIRALLRECSVPEGEQSPDAVAGSMLLAGGIEMILQMFGRK